MEALRQTLTFAFASGIPGGTIDRHFEEAPLPESSWDPERFAAHVFLPELIGGCLCFTLDGRVHAPRPTLLGRVLSRPPGDRETVELRREVFRELVGSAELRRDLEQAYAALGRFRIQIESISISRRVDASRRRLDILTALKAALDALADGFGEARSGLARLRGFGASVRRTEGYRRLADLLAYDEELATLDLRIRVGADGRVRELRALAIRENKDNRFHRSPIGRLLTKLAMMWRGYRFSEDELLARHVTSVFEGVEDEVASLLQLSGQMEFYLAGLALRDRAATAGLEVCLPEFVAPEGARALTGLFNPLLLGSSSGIVPCDLDTERHDMTVIVTGPNSGGKTRLLQALALSQVLGQTGFFVPAASARLAVSRGLFVSLIEQAHADQTEGRLGTELLRIRALFEAMQVGDMVVLDELCSGTNPSEGEEIFQLVASLLSELRPQAFITTHFLQLAERLERDRPVERLAFLQVELDAKQWPTYRFVPGVAQTSLAHRTAARLGVTREELVALVERSKRAHSSRGA